MTYQPANQTTQERLREQLSFILMDGQNQIHDLKDGTATPEEITERMFKSLDYFEEKLLQLIETEIKEPLIKSYQLKVQDFQAETVRVSELQIQLKTIRAETIDEVLKNLISDMKNNRKYLNDLRQQQRTTLRATNDE